MTKLYKGSLYQASCLCGEVSLQVSGFSEQAGHCHCSMCRKFHGAAFATLVEVTDIQWLTGRALLQDYTANNGTIRTFCRQCGSSIGFRVKGLGLEQIELAISLFDEEIPINPDVHIYTQYKANWYDIDDSLVQHAHARDS
ncbi:GFA family protein [Gammaproteobacteria bacterium AS21]